jgi:hypothetical protein
MQESLRQKTLLIEYALFLQNSTLKVFLTKKGSDSRKVILRERDQYFSSSTRIYCLAAFLSVFEVLLFFLARSALLGLGILN